MNMNRNDGEVALNNEVEAIYSDFKRDFTATHFPAVFEWLNTFNTAVVSAKRKHLGQAAHPLLLSPHPIFQTPVHKNPSLMLVGNNNSWFDKKSPVQAQKNLNQLVTGIPRVNSYMTHYTDFGIHMKKIFGPDKHGFRGLGRLDLLADSVGVNRLWIQIGTEDKPIGFKKGMKSASLERSPILGESFKDYCESRTRKLIQVIEPQVLVLLGTPAHGLYNKQEEPQGTQVVYSDHPANRRGGALNVANAIRPYL